MNASTPRYCQCGKRLAHDRAGMRCGACERQAVQQRATPPVVPSGFWDSQAFRDAFDAQHMGRVARAYRRHPSHVARYGRDGIPQELLGGWLGLTQAQVSRIENGQPIRNLDTLAHWARVLQIPAELLWFKLPYSQNSTEPASRFPDGLPAMEPGGSFQLVPVGSGPLRDPDAAAMRAFRSADLQVGGGHLYESVIKYLQSSVAPRLFGSDDGADNRVVFTAAAALTEMAGWMAHDAGRDETARQHFGRSLALAGVGGDHQPSAHVLGSMSHLASHLDQPDEAVQLARQGQAVLHGGSPNPNLQARLLALEARGVAGRHDKDAAGCVQLLVDAERTLETPPSEPASPWVSNFDEGSLASETARCMRQLGDFDEARRQAERIVMLRPTHRTRSRAFGQLALVAVLVAQGRPDEACDIATDVLAATQALGSYLVISQLLDLVRQLQPYRSNAAVSSFLDCLEPTIQERLGLYQWLARDGRSQRSHWEG
jgi:transcriptional regulator with XRE-family HTH domain